MKAIRENRFHILTHAEFLDEMRDRHRAIEADFAEDRDVPEARRIFEQTRRKTVDNLFSMPARD